MYFINTIFKSKPQNKLNLKFSKEKVAKNEFLKFIENIQSQRASLHN